MKNIDEAMDAEIETRSIASTRDWVSSVMILCFLGLLSVSTFGGYLSTTFAFRNGLDAALVSKGLSLLFEASAVVACILAAVRYGRHVIVLAPLSCFLVFGWFLLTVAWSPVPSVAFTRWLIGFSVFLAFLFIHRELGSEFSFRILKWFLTGVILVSFAAIYLDPSAVHDGTDEESLAGQWRGIFLHKNQAGCYAAMASIVFLISFFGSRKGLYRRVADLLMLALSVYFLLRTNSSTSILSLSAAVAALALFTLGGNISIYRVITTILLSCALLVLGGVVWTYWDAILEILRDPRAFTGRGALWQVLWQRIEEAPVLGVGYGSFWDLGDQSPIAFYEGMWFSEIIQGHNGYLDIMLTTGAIGLALAVWAAFVTPLHAALWRLAGNSQCQSLCVASVVFFMIHNLMESTLFRQAQPLWVLFLSIALMIFGERAAASTTRVEGSPGKSGSPEPAGDRLPARGLP